MKKRLYMKSTEEKPLAPVHGLTVQGFENDHNENPIWGSIALVGTLAVMLAVALAIGGSNASKTGPAFGVLFLGSFAAYYYSRNYFSRMIGRSRRLQRKYFHKRKLH